MVNLFGRQTKVEVGLEVIQKYSEEEYEELREERHKERQAEEQSDTDSFQYADVISGVFAGSRCRILETTRKRKQ